MTALDVLLVAVFAVSLTFVLWYGTTRRWWGSLEGWALIVSATGWTLVSGGFAYDDWVADVPEEMWVLVTTVALISACMKLALLVLDPRRKTKP